MTMDNCPICTRHVASHAKQIKCRICFRDYHMKCLSLKPEDHSYMFVNASQWYCVECTSEILPYNHIDEDEMYLLEITEIDVGTRTIESLSELLFNPFETNTDESYSPLNGIDPDIQFFNDLDYHMSLNCNYYFEDSLMEILHKRVPNHLIGNEFSLCHMNIRSLKANPSSFEICLENTGLRFSIIGVSDTLLNDVTCNLYNIHGYNLVETHRSGRTGGGVGIYVRHDISFEKRNDLALKAFDQTAYESVFTELDKNTFEKDKNIIIVVIYRPPGTDLKLFNENMESLLSYLKNENKLCYLIGDYNVNLFNYGKHKDTTDFVDMLHSNSFISLINRPTMIKKESATLIDNIFTNCYTDLENSFQCLIYTDITDHFPIIHVDFKTK